MSDQSQKENEKKTEFWASPYGFAFLAIVVIAIWIVNFYAMPHFFPSSDGSEINAGTAGDMFGGITALFSGLAFAGLVTTLFMQRRELELQREELRQTREVFSVQRFENTFFGLLGLLNEHVNSIVSSFEIDPKKNRLTAAEFEDLRGKEALVAWSKELPTLLVTNEMIYDEYPFSGFSKKQMEDSCEKAIRQYGDIYITNLETHLGPYFRLIGTILQHIENADVSKNEEENQQAKLEYAKILRARLNSSEVRHLMFYCVSEHGKDLKKWVEKYSLLKYLSYRTYDTHQPILERYDLLAFQFDER